MCAPPRRPLPPELTRLPIHATPAQDSGRYGVYAGPMALQRAARSWAGTVAGWAGFGRSTPVAVAAFPLERTLTAANLLRDPQQGPVLRELVQLGVVDERSAVMLHLAVERQRLRQSGASGGGSLPWLALLPSTFSTPLYFSGPDLQWLRGTTLHKATRCALPRGCGRGRHARDAWSPSCCLMPAGQTPTLPARPTPCLAPPAACARRACATAGRGWSRRRGSWRRLQGFRPPRWRTGSGPALCFGLVPSPCLPPTPRAAAVW